MAKLRNVIIAAVATLTVLFGGVAIYGTSQVKSAEQQFVASGYILDGAENRENGYAKLSFEAGTTYRTGYPDSVIFKDTAGIEVATDKTAFLHFSDGSLSALTDGVIVDLNNMTGGVLNNFRINAGTVLERRDNSYVIESLSGTIYLDDFIWKISDSQYMLVSNTVDVAVGEQEPKYFNDAVELRYYNEGILMLLTEAGAYRTVATDCIATMNSGVKMDLASRTILTDEEGSKMSMEQIVLDANEAIDVLSPIMSAQKSDDLFDKKQLNEAVKIAMPTFEVIDGEDGDDGEDGEAGEEGAIGQSGMTGADGLAGETGENGKQGLDGVAGEDGAGGAPGAPGDPGTAGASGANGANGRNGANGAKGAQGQQGEQGRDGDDILEEEGLIGELPEQVVLPEFGFSEFDTTSDSVTASITYTEGESCALNRDSIVVSLIRTADGKEVKKMDMSVSGFDPTSSPFEVIFEDLVPEQEYTMQVVAGYTVKATDYTNVFISKTFTTSSLGIELNYVYATEDKLAFMPVKKTGVGYAEITDARVTLRDLTNGSEKTVSVDFDAPQEIVFDGLTPNRAYEVKYTEVAVGNEVIPSYGAAQYYTLKRKPVIGNPEVVVNKVEGLFDLRLDSVKDEDNGIQYYRYEIYAIGAASAEITSDAVPVKEIYATSHREVLCPVVGEIKRDQYYRMRVVVCFDDNEKLVEYTSIASGPFIMDGTGYPVVTFEKKEGTDYGHDYLEGTVYIDTNGAAISAAAGAPLRITYASSTGVVKEVSHDAISSYQDGANSDRYAIPFKESGLKAGDSYVLSVYGTLNLNDDRGDVNNALIGRVVVGTEAAPRLQVNLSQDTANITNAVAVKLSVSNPAGQSDVRGAHAAHTAQKIRVNIYNGIEPIGTPVVSREITAKTPYNTTTMQGGFYDEIYNGNSITLTEAADSLNFNLNLIDKEQYTVEVKMAYDYTDYANELMEKDQSVYMAFDKKAVRPDEDLFISNPLSVVAITNAYATTYGGTKNPLLTEEAIVGYYLKVNYGQLTGNEAKVTYYAFEEARVSEKDSAQEFYSAFANTNTPDATMLMKFTKEKQDGNMMEHTVWFGNTASGGAAMKRGSKYIFSVRVEMNDDSYFPSDSKPVAKTISYPAPYINPVLQFVPWEINPAEGKLSYRYKIKAQDAAAVADEFSIPAGSTYTFKDAASMTVNKNNEKTILALEDARSGRIAVQCEVRRFNTNYAQDVQYVINHYVDASVTAETAEAKLSYVFIHEPSKNRIRIQVTDEDSKGSSIRQIAGLRLEIFNDSTAGSAILKTLPITWNSVIDNTADAYVYYSELEACKGHTRPIRLQAVFDTEISGYQLIESSNSTVAIQTVESQKRGNYVTPNQSATGFFINTSGTAKDSWYTVNQGDLFANSSLGFDHALTNFKGAMYLSVEAAGTRLGALTDNNYVSLKQLTNVLVKHDRGDGTTEEKTDFTITEMLPTITLNDSPVTYTIYPTADSARVDFIINGHASLINSNKIKNEDGKYYIYFDLWSINANGVREPMVAADHCGKVAINAGQTQYINAESQPALITGLSKNMKYGIALYYLDETGAKKYPLDTYRPDVNNDNIMFTFTTADAVEIQCTDVDYKAFNYNDKSIVASLKFNTYVGYDIVYELVKKTGADTYIPLLTSSQLENLEVIYKTTSILSVEKDISLQLNPGQLHWMENGVDTKFTFERDDLFLMATPVSKQDDTKALGEPCYIPLNEPSLKAPYYNLRITPQDAATLRVRVSITDVDRVMVDDYYMMRIFNGDTDITPEELQKKQFSSLATQTFEIGNLQQDITYTIKLYSILDMENAGGIDAIDVVSVIPENCLKTVTANTLTTSGYDFGQMSLGNTSVNYLALYFTDSVGLQDNIRYIQYTVVNPDSSYYSYEWDSYVEGFQVDGNSICAYLKHSFSEKGEYTVQFRFLNASRVSLGNDTTLTYIKGY